MKKKPKKPKKKIRNIGEQEHVERLEQKFLEQEEKETYERKKDRWG
jgi:hypothetical protein